jgi:hypothetical protein
VSSPKMVLTLLLALGLAATGCRTWEVNRQPLEETLAEGDVGLLRVFTASGELIEMRNPRLADSLLTGMTRPLRGEISRPVSVLTRDIVRTELHPVSVGRTVGAVALGATIVAVGVALIQNSGSDQPPPPPPPTTLSCPLVYSWDGQDWRLDSGTFGGAITRGLARTDIDNLDHLRVVDGRIRLRMANELAETDYVDRVSLLMVEHPVGTTVAPGTDGSVHVLSALAAPIRATDDRGRDVLPRVAERDDWSWESDLVVRDASAHSPELRDGIDVTFHRPAGSRTARLVVDAHNTPWSAHLLVEMIRAHGSETSAWYAALDGNPEMARAFGRHLAEQAFLRVSVQSDDEWVPQGVVWEAGPEIVKRQVIEVDLGALEEDVVTLRLDAPPAFWRIDRVRMEFDGAEGPETALSVTSLEASSARTAAGVDVRAVLADADDHHVVLETGERVDLTFDAPDATPGVERTFLLDSHGWYRVHTTDEGKPDRDVLRRIETEPAGVSRIAVERLNRAVLALSEVEQ